MLKIPSDKILHFLAGFLMVLTVAWFTNIFIGFAIGVTAGLVKELYDGATGRGTSEGLDFLATGIGASAGMVGFLLLFGVPSI